MKNNFAMQSKLKLYNSLTRRKKIFTPINPPNVGMYVCGPTVYSNAHLGHARPAITFDLLYRYLLHLGYKVRYIRNITDVGHLENDADEGEDKIEKKAKIENIEPMEVVQKYLNNYLKNMGELNILPPSIEPRASGHIIEQQDFIKKIKDNGYAYEVNGSVYFNVWKYRQNYNYGKLSGRKVEDLKANTRSLQGQNDKRNILDFALWKKASPEHLMRWRSEWSEGFPGWHIECSAMSEKYLGKVFDIHGGGMDLKFPHHECEIAQSTAANGKESVKCWMHNNMITINGQKMARSLGNFITLDELFTGESTLLDKRFDPMTIRFFILLSHYRSPLDFSNKALLAAENKLSYIMRGFRTLNKINPSLSSTLDIKGLRENCYYAINDDLNTPLLISYLFEGVKYINSVNDGKAQLNNDDLELLKNIFNVFIIDILGLREEIQEKYEESFINNVIDASLNIRSIIKRSKDWNTSDKIREELKKIGILIKDNKDNVEWELE